VRHYRRGYGAIYMDNVLQADEGCDFGMLRRLDDDDDDTDLPLGLLKGWVLVIDHPAFATATSAVVCDALDRMGLRNQALDPAIRPMWPWRSNRRVCDARRRRVRRGAPRAAICKRDGGARRTAAGRAPGDGDRYRQSRRCVGRAVLVWCDRSRAVGAICDGYIRDARQIEELQFPTFARGCSPLDTLGRAVVTSYGEVAICGGVRVSRGDLIIADIDGIVTVPQDALDAVAEAVTDKRKLEAGARADLMAGMTIHEVWDKYQVF
jgi:hypothetical protein